MAPSRPVTILLIEDEPSIVRALIRLLHHEGYTVDTADNGQRALAQLHTQPYDLILCDVHLPVLDGVAFYTLLAQQAPTLCQRVIFLTGDTLGAASTAFLAQCGQPCLYKPCTAAEVRCTLQQQLEAVGRATGEALPEGGTLSIVRRGAGYQVRYAANNPYAAEHAPWTCPDEDTLCAWLDQVGIETEALQHACAVARQGCVAVLCLRVAPAQLPPCLCPTP
jgi:CheY-like chemotaxis protein